MIRPIDTQILYPQSPALSNRQQHINEQGVLQQAQFAELLKKENQNKKETVEEIDKKQKLSYKKDEKRDKHNKKQNKKGEEQNKKIKQRHIDIRI